MSEHGKVEGDGYALANLDDLGEGYGFRKIRKELDVKAFGINAIVMPPGHAAGFHSHEEQEETYFVHQGTAEFSFGDGTKHVVGSGGVVRVDAPTVLSVKNVGEDDLVYVCAGGKDGYVGRDGVMAEGASRSEPPA
ncbi:MAG: hypothetical protein AVDCRST_MAG85-1235 [uncultured Solirubrobacteraceae bacterium]|uniref:Cupin type-2 domain-containing protein n=1 Tax=uncultured Solirubrobacteraceae bacterium TaxID=1162706 RepID=A0A6J4SGM8_9ACTN|nr:MAG: hypothetical protein AVDCRST_MAG85-1235 [uncultured Solirubrobacteraceae bacterium]